MKITENGKEHDWDNEFCPACDYDLRKGKKKLVRCTTCSQLFHTEITNSNQAGEVLVEKCGCP